MENDTVRTIGDSTMVDVWLKGRMRSVSVTREAITAFLDLPSERADAITDEERSDFVRRNLSKVAAAAMTWLADHPGMDMVTIEAGQLPRQNGTDDRRSGDRRKGDRRKANLGPRGAERRRS